MTSPQAGEIREDKFTAARRHVPASVNHVYLNIASRSIISDASKAAADWMVDGHWQTDIPKSERMPQLDQVRQKVATLLGATPDEVAVLKNVSEGLNHIATSLDWQSGDNVVLCSELEHPSNIYLWLALRRHGVELKHVPAKDGAINPEAMAAAIDERTRIVTASSVTFTPGFRTGLRTIGKAAREKGAFFLIDGVQSCGVLKLDVSEEYIDGLATSTSKGLMGLMGLGFLYVRKEWFDRLSPAFVSRYSVERHGGHESEIESFEFDYAPSARRYEIGNYNWIGIAVANTSIGEILDLGIEDIEVHALALARRLSDGFKELGFPVREPATEAERSHLVTIGQLGMGDTYETDDERLNRVARDLESAGVRFSIRRGLLRFGFHYYNSENDVDQVLEIASKVN